MEGPRWELPLQHLDQPAGLEMRWPSSFAGIRGHLSHVGPRPSLSLCTRLLNGHDISSVPPFPLLDWAVVARRRLDEAICACGFIQWGSVIVLVESILYLLELSPTGVLASCGISAFLRKR